MGPDLLEVYIPWTGEIVKTTHTNLMNSIWTLNKLSRPVELWSLLYAFGIEQTVSSKGVDILKALSEMVGSFLFVKFTSAIMQHKYIL